MAQRRIGQEASLKPGEVYADSALSVEKAIEAKAEPRS
jgi:hypothetical protein